MRDWKYNWMVFSAVVVHAIWGCMLLVSDAPLHCTPMAETPFRHLQYMAAIIYIAAAIMALVPIMSLYSKSTLVDLVLCTPQQILLMMSAMSAIWCIIRGAYADGEPRPRMFIAADQLWVIVSMCVHTFALIDWYVFSEKRVLSPMNGLSR